MPIHFWAHLTSSALPLRLQHKIWEHNSSLVQPQSPAMLWSPLPEQSSKIKNNRRTRTLSSKNQTFPVYFSLHSFFFLSSFLGFLHKPPSFSLFPSSSPQQPINAAPSPSITRAVVLLHFPSHTAREQHLPCTPCMTSTNLFRK
jgi:hypothetical protein